MRTQHTLPICIVEPNNQRVQFYLKPQKWWERVGRLSLNQIKRTAVLRCFTSMLYALPQSASLQIPLGAFSARAFNILTYTCHLVYLENHQLGQYHSVMRMLLHKTACWVGHYLHIDAVVPEAVRKFEEFNTRLPPELAITCTMI